MNWRILLRDPGESTNTVSDSTIGIDGSYFILKTLDVFSRFTLSDMLRLSMHVSTVGVLVIKNNRVGAFQSLMSRFNALTEFTINNAVVPESDLIALFTNSRLLKSVDIIHCKVTDAVISSIAAHCSCLENFSLFPCQVRCDTIDNIFVSCPRLTSLYVGSWYTIENIVPFIQSKKSIILSGGYWETFELDTNNRLQRALYFNDALSRNNCC